MAASPHCGYEIYLDCLCSPLGGGAVAGRPWWPLHGGKNRMAREINNGMSGQGLWRILRCRRTHRYFTGDGWEPDLSRAKRYSSQAEAVEEYYRRRLNEAELVLRMPGTVGEFFQCALPSVAAEGSEPSLEVRC